ncbi:MAG: anhydro-N-acetylmuramic acid kinase [Balneolales bacterium]|nr:anhydro-N-acetylmuramic acid kinase [Balneolales bacterium]
MDHIFNKDKSLIVAGCLSGTSIDGLDVILVRFMANSANIRTPMFEILATETFPLPAELSVWLHQRAFQEQEYYADLLKHEREFSLFIAESIKNLTKRSLNDDEMPNLIGSHGQTIFHLGKDYSEDSSAVSLQIGDGSVIAEASGVITISDFRKSFIAAGGDGAPLAPVLERYLLADEHLNRIFINIGGISNIHFCRPAVDPRYGANGDTGPGNTLIDSLVRLYYPGMKYDDGGRLAFSGRVDNVLLRNCLKDPYFYKDLPKSTGPEYFNLDWLEEKMGCSIANYPSAENAIATVSELTAKSLALAIDSVLKPETQSESEILVSGGGLHNAYIMKRLSELSGCRISDFDKTGIPSDFKESFLFAWLAYLSYIGATVECPETGASVRAGKVSFPGWV